MSALAAVPEDDLTRLAREVRTEYRAAEAAFESAVRHAHRCGSLLVEAKAIMRRGEWLPWLAEVGVPARTAQVYMTVARKYADPAYLPTTVTEALAPFALDGGEQLRLFDRSAADVPEADNSQLEWDRLPYFVTKGKLVPPRNRSFPELLDWEIEYLEDELAKLYRIRSAVSGER